jgi:hypothetical protein
VTPGHTAARRAFVLAALRLLSLFALVFYGADWLATLHTWRVTLNTAWELRLPYVAPLWPVYFSVLGVPFLMARPAVPAAAIADWERRMAMAIAVAGLAFVLLPAQTANPPVAPTAMPWDAFAALARATTGRYNLLPSLHVALSLLTLIAASPFVREGTRWLLWAWFALLVASVLLTHQHHVADVVAGIALALALARRRRPA